MSITIESMNYSINALHKDTMARTEYIIMAPPPMLEFGTSWTVIGPSNHIAYIPQYNNMSLTFYILQSPNTHLTIWVVN